MSTTATDSDGLVRESTSNNYTTRGDACGWLRYFNLTAITILSCVVGTMFVQLQYVTFELNQEKKAMAALAEQVTTQQQSQIEDLSEQVKNNQTFTVIQCAGTFVLITCLLTMFHMSTHLRNYFEPVVQRKIITILFMSPIYGVTSFLSLMVPTQMEGFLSIIKDFYEAYVIYTFLAFLIAVLGRGDRDVAVQVLAKNANHLEEPTRYLRRWYHPLPEESPTAKANAVLLECQMLAMQFVFCRPLTSIASFVVTVINEDPVSNYFLSPQFWIAMIQNVSVFFAFTGLLKFYHAVQSDLSWISPFSKFLSIKAIVFLTFWQGLVINILVHLKNNGQENGGDVDDDGSAETPREEALYIQNLLICLEMVFFSIAHWCVFPPNEWQHDYRPSALPKPSMGFSDFVSDVNIIGQSYKQAGRQRRMKDGEYMQANEMEEIDREDDVDDEEDLSIRKST